MNTFDVLFNEAKKEDLELEIKQDLFGGQVEMRLKRYSPTGSTYGQYNFVNYMFQTEEALIVKMLEKIHNFGKEQPYEETEKTEHPV